MGNELRCAAPQTTAARCTLGGEAADLGLPPVGAEEIVALALVSPRLANGRTAVFVARPNARPHLGHSDQVLCEPRQQAGSLPWPSANGAKGEGSFSQSRVMASATRVSP